MCIRDRVIIFQNLKIPNDYQYTKTEFTASINLLVCHEICIPESDIIKLTLNDENTQIQDNTSFIEQTRKKIPQPINGEFTYGAKNGNLILNLETEDQTLFENTDLNKLEFFPYEWGVIQYLETPAVTKKGTVIEISHPVGDRTLSELENLQGLVVIKGDKGENIGYEITSQPEQTTLTSSSTPETKNVQTTTQDQNNPSELTWLTALFFALLGGMILNLMPCVFPVLSIKALSLIKMSEKGNAQARTHGIAYTLGVVISFIAMGIALIVLREAGSAVGWGFQLQNPVIITLLAYLLFAVGLNLMGFFDLGGALGNVGNNLTQGDTITSSFFAGALVTFVAAPCIGPFLGAAMGYAITQPPIFNILFFAILGLGLALPYLILAFIPQTRTCLPKPGAWMDSFKQALSFPMFAAAIVFIWILGQQAGTNAILIALLGFLLISLVTWLSKYKDATGIKQIITYGLMLLTILGLLYSIYAIKRTSLEALPISSHEKGFGESFSKKRLEELLKTDQPVFVEMTAAWCFTCKINHAVAINIESTKTTFKNKNIKYLVGDWTNHNQEITDYLATFGRNGVPLYVFYGSPNPQTNKRPEPVLLPQILTPAIVQETVAK